MTTDQRHTAIYWTLLRSGLLLRPAAIRTPTGPRILRRCVLHPAQVRPLALRQVEGSAR